jgi:hypothetical protein
MHALEPPPPEQESQALGSVSVDFAGPIVGRGHNDYDDELKPENDSAAETFSVCATDEIEIDDTAKEEQLSFEQKNDEPQEQAHKRSLVGDGVDRRSSMLIDNISEHDKKLSYTYTYDYTNLRPELIEKINAWLISFYRLDPRYKILKFFNQVAADGADNMVDDDDSDDEDDQCIYNLRRDSVHLGLARSFDPRDSERHASIRDKLRAVFDTTSILTVWRPCSNDAMRKMMEGTGVGKGLDIKGKSAKKGLLSAFVPFMQIHENEDKEKIQELYENAHMRVYFHSENARQTAIDTILPHANMMEVEYKIPDYLQLLDTFADKGLYGIEVSQRLFWEGCIVSQDITRNEDTVTGRPSLAGFQDANMKTLKVACNMEPTPSPMPVVMQYDKENAIRPHTLVMAYEENGTVTPVVSDFDGFLLGWRREALWFGCNLPEEQEDLMMWCLDHIEDILEEDPSSESWTVQWLEILKEESSNGFVPEIPEYGFGDPKSYGIMEKAANKLVDTGAVRHGSECFNYYFPQEIDDYFLLVSDTFRPVPWKYVNVAELQDILIQKIQEGFVFPLNPKWVLCDPGWKRVYDELMKSDALYAENSKDVWFPHDIGIREKIEEIYERCPDGFQQEGNNGGMSGRMAHDLASLELETYNQNKKKNKLGSVMKKAGKKTWKKGKQVGKKTAKMAKRTGSTVVAGTTAASKMTAQAAKKTRATVIGGTAVAVELTAEVGKKTVATVIGGTAAAGTAIGGTSSARTKTMSFSKRTTARVSRLWKCMGRAASINLQQTSTRDMARVTSARRPDLAQQNHSNDNSIENSNRSR